VNLIFRRFRSEYYPDYASWFSDPELNRRLGPMDRDWLDCVLSEPEAAGEVWAVFRGPELVAVVETAYDPQGTLPAAITGVATKPALRRQGIGVAVLRHIVAVHRSRGIAEQIAYISVDNLAGRRCAESAGFAAVQAEPDEHGYVEFRLRQSADL
jgi:GNAT superfamily N-acetyltransferase